MHGVYCVPCSPLFYSKSQVGMKNSAIIKGAWQLVAKVLLFLILLSQFAVQRTWAQTSQYAINSFQDVYEELETYSSVAILTQGQLLWDYEFELEFPFPFFDSAYTRMFYKYDPWGSFTEEQDDALFLMYYNFTYEKLLDTVDIMSDVRFAHVDAGDQRAFVLQFAKARFFADPFEDTLDTYLNFQHWFYENGVIEVRFGEIHMDSTPIYAPGKGFYEYTTSGGVDTTYIAGPYVGIANPINEDDAIGLQGAYDDYEVVGDQYSVLTVMPPVGWVIQFVPEWVSAVSGPSRYEQVAICPNPANAFIRLPEGTGRVSVVDAAGRQVYRGQPGVDRLDVSGFVPGMYVVQYTQGGRVHVGRFVRM